MSPPEKPASPRTESSVSTESHGPQSHVHSQQPPQPSSPQLREILPRKVSQHPRPLAVPPPSAQPSQLPQQSPELLEYSMLPPHPADAVQMTQPQSHFEQLHPDLQHSVAPYSTHPMPRQRTSIACRYCRRRKIRCSGFEEAPDGRCTNCERFKQECIFTPVSSHLQGFVPVHSVYPHLRQGDPPPLHQHMAPQPGFGAPSMTQRERPPSQGQAVSEARGEPEQTPEVNAFDQRPQLSPFPPLHGFGPHQQPAFYNRGPFLYGMHGPPIAPSFPDAMYGRPAPPVLQPGYSIFPQHARPSPVVNNGSIPPSSQSPTQEMSDKGSPSMRAAPTGSNETAASTEPSGSNLKRPRPEEFDRPTSPMTDERNGKDRGTPEVDDKGGEQSGASAESQPKPPPRSVDSPHKTTEARHRPGTPTSPEPVARTTAPAAPLPIPPHAHHPPPYLNHSHLPYPYAFGPPLAAPSVPENLPPMALFPPLPFGGLPLMHFYHPHQLPPHFFIAPQHYPPDIQHSNQPMTGPLPPPSPMLAHYQSLMPAIAPYGTPFTFPIVDARALQNRAQLGPKVGRNGHVDLVDVVPSQRISDVSDRRANQTNFGAKIGDKRHVVTKGAGVANHNDPKLAIRSSHIAPSIEAGTSSMRVDNHKTSPSTPSHSKIRKTSAGSVKGKGKNKLTMQSDIVPSAAPTAPSTTNAASQKPLGMSVKDVLGPANASPVDDEDRAKR